MKCMQCGKVDLVGGYYDAGDNVKFGLPMAHTITMLSWSVIEYGKHLANSGELGYSMEAIQWGTDYLLKAHSEPNLLYGQVSILFLLCSYVIDGSGGDRKS